VQIDEPKFGTSIRQNQLPNVTSADAKSVANAIELKHLLKERITGDYNPELIKRYPELKAIVPAPAKRDLLVPVRTP
jgi:hypothetical protein